AWFRRPSRRAAAVYSACFGAPETDELVYRKGADFTYVNTTHVYSDTCALTVCVVDESGKPAGNLTVVVSVFNYGALRPIARRATSEKGEAEFVLGLGEYVVSCGTGESARAWKIFDTRAGTAVSGASTGAVSTKTQLSMKLVLSGSAAPDAKFWLRYPKLE
ncbi:MAG: hypothetical protein RDV41_05505, partial [Planctomycetota bacterium]|nr:hypothetical protein [Planctomycetota bacterium]